MRVMCGFATSLQIFIFSLTEQTFRNNRDVVLLRLTSDDRVYFYNTSVPQVSCLPKLKLQTQLSQDIVPVHLTFYRSSRW